MKEKIESVAHGIKFMELETLIKRMIGHQLSFAAWKLPNDQNTYLLVDLESQPKQSLPIEELNKCFVINPYNESHPPNPVILQGDIIITMRGSNKQLELSPSLSSAQLDQFNRAIQKEVDEEFTDYEKEAHDSSPFTDKVQQTIDYIKAGNASKIVISRFEDVELNKDYSPSRCFDKLKTNYPTAFCYLTHTAEKGTWLGASPERLISIENNRFFRTESLAGTQYLPDVADLGDVAWTQKEIEEQAMVSRYIIDCLKKIRLREFTESGPKTVRAGKLVHLKTEYLVDMIETNMPDLGSIMLELLHPTSAVCGAPREAADLFIQQNEGYDRELYAGFLGPVNFKESTSLYVNLRCMQLFNKKARLYAGAGITENSNPQKEYLETVNKMKTLLDIL